MSTSVDECVARNVRAELARRLLSQTVLADALGISQSAVSRRLLGTTSWTIAELATVARLLKVPMTVLVPESADEPAGVAS